MTDVHTTTSGVASPASSLVAAAATASVLWVVGEFAVRRGLTAPIGNALGTSTGGFAATLALSGVVLALAVALLGTRVDIAPADWGLSLSKRGVLEAVGVLVAYYAALAIVSYVATTVFGLDPSAGTAGVGFDGPTWTLVAVVLANGVVVPVAEEVAWRGVVQTALVDALGAVTGIAITAGVFAAKHVVVDLGVGPLRLFSLAVLAIAFGVLRHRHGTGASTVSHVLVNTSATVPLVLA